MFQKAAAVGFEDALPGIQRRTLVFGEKTLMTEFLMEADTVLPRHSHPHEQIGYLVRGRMRLCLGTEKFEVEPGDSWCIPGGMEHNAEILEPSLAIEVFAPGRTDYLPRS